MNSSHRWMAVLVSALALSAGCTKTVHVAFVNEGQNPLAFSIIDGPEHIAQEPAGTLDPGEVYRRTFKIKKDRLPQTYSWTASAMSGNSVRGKFTIDEESQDHYTVWLPKGPYWDAVEFTEYKRTRKVNDVPTPIGEPQGVVE